MIPERDWLVKAKRLAIGSKVRVYHGRERRPNLTIANYPDRYWCYCQSCKDGAVLLKSHVILGGAAPAESASLVLPTDSEPMTHEHPAWHFIASKNMDAMYLPDLWYSPSRKRILIDTKTAGWYGRDVTGHSMQKWLSYNGADIVRPTEYRDTAVVVEDLFSMYKVRFACPEYAVYCALGTGIKDSLVLALLQHKTVLFFFDGDAAGWAGARNGVQRLRGLGMPNVGYRSPKEGEDPKDMDLMRIKDALLLF